jgi:hypothetical protein
MRVYTNLNVLKKVKRLFNEMGIGGVLDGDEANIDISVGKLLDRLLYEGKLVEFLQIITNDNQTDFEEMEADQVGGLIENFFTGIVKYLPSFLREMVNIQYRQKMSS